MEEPPGEDARRDRGGGGRGRRGAAAPERRPRRAAAGRRLAATVAAYLPAAGATWHAPRTSRRGCGRPTRSSAGGRRRRSRCRCRRAVGAAARRGRLRRGCRPGTIEGLAWPGGPRRQVSPRRQRRSRRASQAARCRVARAGARGDARARSAALKAPITTGRPTVARGPREQAAHRHPAPEGEAEDAEARGPQRVGRVLLDQRVEGREGGDEAGPGDEAAEPATSHCHARQHGAHGRERRRRRRRAACSRPRPSAWPRWAVASAPTIAPTPKLESSRL